MKTYEIVDDEYVTTYVLAQVRAVTISTPAGCHFGSDADKAEAARLAGKLAVTIRYAGLPMCGDSAAHAFHVLDGKKARQVYDELKIALRDA